MVVVCVLVGKRRHRRFLARAHSAVAKVVHSWSEEYTTDSRTFGDQTRTSYHVSVEYPTEDGRLFSANLLVGELMEPGTEIPVIYDPDDPNDVRAVRPRLTDLI